MMVLWLHLFSKDLCSLQNVSFVDKESLWQIAEIKFFSEKFWLGFGNVVLNRMVETLLQLIAVMLA